MYSYRGAGCSGESVLERFECAHDGDGGGVSLLYIYTRVHITCSVFSEGDLYDII